MKRVKRFGVLQTAKVVAVIYFFLAAIFVIPWAIFMSSFGNMMPNSESQLSGFLLIFVPFVYAILGFIITAIGCAIYNLVSKWVGGIEVEVEAESSF